MAAITGRVGGIIASGSLRQTGDQELGARMTGEGNFLQENLSGRYAERNYRGLVSFFSVDQVTVPVNANNLVSVFGIYNPPGSKVLLEIIDAMLFNPLATTVVDGYGFYSSTVALSALATFTTPGSARSRRMQDPPLTAARVYTAVTHSGTPSLEAIIGAHGAATSQTGMNKEYNGSLSVPPGVLVSIATMKTIGTASGMTIGVAWADVPL